MWELLGEAIWNGAIEAVARQTTQIYGAALNAQVRRIVEGQYPNLRASSQASLQSYVVESIRTARAYNNAAPDFRPAIGDLPDVRRVVQYAADNGGVNLTGYERRVKYSLTYRTRVTDNATGVVTERENLLNVFSSRPLSAGDLRARADAASAQQILFDSTSNRRLQREYLGSTVESVNVTYGIEQS